MFNFREYIEKIEESGMGNTPGVHNDGPGSGFSSGGGLAIVPTVDGSSLPSHWQDTEFIQNQTAFLDGIVRKSLDNLNINKGTLPLVRRNTRVMYIKKEDNPIYVRLADGTNLYFTREEWQRAGKPDVGKRVMVVLQRRPDDNSSQLSQIHHIETY